MRERERERERDRERERERERDISQHIKKKIRKGHVPWGQVTRCKNDNNKNKQLKKKGAIHKKKICLMIYLASCVVIVLYQGLNL